MTSPKSETATFEMEASLHDAKGGVYVAMEEISKAVACYEKSLDIGRER